MTTNEMKTQKEQRAREIQEALAALNQQRTEINQREQELIQELLRVDGAIGVLTEMENSEPPAEE